MTALMNEKRLFAPREVEEITEVTYKLQVEWRRRGYLPSMGQRKWTKSDFNDLCRIALIKALIDAGFAGDEAREYARPHFASCIEVFLRTKLRANPFVAMPIPSNARQFAVIRTSPEAIFGKDLYSDLSSLAQEQEEIPFKTLVIVNLKLLGWAMAAAIDRIDQRAGLQDDLAQLQSPKSRRAKPQDTSPE